MKLFLRRVLSFSLSIIFVLGFLIYMPKPATAINKVWLEVLPRKVSSKATYKIHFSIEKFLEVHQWIKLVWPQDTKLPPLPEDKAAREKELTRIIESMSIGLSPCSACQGLPIIDYKENSLMFNTHIALDPKIDGYQDIVITVPDRVGVVNPSKPGKYVFKIATGAEPTMAVSAPYEIVESKIGEPEGMPTVEVNPTTYKMAASYKVGFNVGKGGWLPAGEGRTRIRFPAGTILSKRIDQIPDNAVTINGKNPPPNGITIGQNMLSVVTPDVVPDSGRVEIFISEKAGIINPSKPGDYTIDVSTLPGDPEWVPTNTYKIEKAGALLNVIPAKVSKNAEYSIVFILEDGINIAKGEKIIIKFPDGTIIPQQLDIKSVFINDTEVSNVGVSKSEVSLYSKVYINSGDTVEIKFNKECGIINTNKSGEVKLGLKLQSFKEFLFTSGVILVESKLEITGISVDPKNAKSKASYKINVLIGDKGALKKDDFIGIIFPNNVKISENGNTNKILVNNSNSEKVIVDNNIIKLYLSEEIPSGTSVLIDIDKEFGLHNPTEMGSDYTLEVFTSSESDYTKSETFVITQPLPETEVIVTGGKKGNDDWYLEPPTVAFICSNPTAKILFYWSGRTDAVNEYDGKAQPLELGQFESILYFYAEDPYGKEETKQIILKVDTVLPDFVIESPSESRTTSTVSPFKLSGRTTQIKTVVYGVDVIDYDKIIYINDTKVPVSSEDGSFNYDLNLNQGENKVVVRGEDLAGNTLTKEFTIIFDNIPPAIEILSPIPDSVVLTPEIKVEGKTEPDVQLLINGEVSFVESDGTFSHDLRIKEAGRQKLIVEATDPVGNITKKEYEFWFGYTIILQIGKTAASINEVDKTLDVAPYIKNGRTFVPVRFIGEALGASVKPVIDPKTKLVSQVIYELGTIKIVLKIGSKDATVNGKKVTLDVPPEIIKGRTFVPVRFVSENLGAVVGWEAKEERITVSYPKI